MAQVTNVKLEIGTADVGSGRIAISGQSDNTGYRIVTVKTTFKFTECEIGLKYRVYAYLYASDRQGEDLDGRAPVLWPLIGEDTGREQVATLTGSRFFNSSYIEITVTEAGNRDLSIESRVNYNTLDEDPGFIPTRRFPPLLKPNDDELFARVLLSAVGESEKTHTAV